MIRDRLLLDVADRIRRADCVTWKDGSASGHADQGRALFVLLQSSQDAPFAGPILTRPLLVVYETGSSRILHQLAGDQVTSLLEGGTERMK